MNVSSLVMSGCLALAIAVVPGKAAQSRNPRSEASDILKQIDADAMQVAGQADHLRGYSMTPDIDWRTHAAALTEIKSVVNDMGTKLRRTESIREAVSPWQRDAIDRASILVREMAGNTEQAIKYLNNNPTYLWSPTYRAYAANLSSEGVRLSQTLGNFEKLAKVRRQESELRSKLGVGGEQ